jgi:hypothetical protein
MSAELRLGERLLTFEIAGHRDGRDGRTPQSTIIAIVDRRRASTH